MDVGFHPIFGLLPAVEVRGTYPIAKGQIVSEKDVLFGLRVQKRYSRVRPYADILFGRGELDYQNGGFIVEAQSFRYIQSTSNVFSPGVGVEIDLKDQYSLLFDGQFQHWNTPFDPGHIYSKTGTVAVVYRFNWLEHGHPGH